MSFPAPSARQAEILWFCLTALAIGLFLGLLGLIVVGIAVVVQQLSSVLLPLAIAGIVAYILDPVVDYLERRGVPRPRAIALVFLLAAVTVLFLLATVVPQLVHQIGELASKVPEYALQLNTTIKGWISGEGWIAKLIDRLPVSIRPSNVWETHGPAIQQWLANALPIVSGWILAQFSRVASWLGLLAGIFLVPVYIFYFLLEKRRIVDNWTDYLPIQESRAKQEIIFILDSINDSLIAFFRGQVLVAMCVGTLTALGFMLVGLKYALLLGAITGILGIVPYLGVMVSIVPALILGVVQFGDWRVLLVALVFVAVQTAEGMIISPRIIGDRVGMHPLTIIVAIMIGTTLMGGILGGVLAIPLTAALRTLMFRYIWKKRGKAALAR